MVGVVVDVAVIVVVAVPVFAVGGVGVVGVVVLAAAVVVFAAVGRIVVVVIVVIFTDVFTGVVDKNVVFFVMAPMMPVMTVMMVVMAMMTVMTIPMVCTVTSLNRNMMFCRLRVIVVIITAAIGGRRRWCCWSPTRSGCDHGPGNATRVERALPGVAYTQGHAPSHVLRSTHFTCTGAVPARAKHAFAMACVGIPGAS